jgi:hypothetical protein
MFDFGRRQCFCESISNHVFGGTVNEMKWALFNDPMNEVKSDVNVLGMSMVLMVLSEGDRQLIVQKKCGGVEVDRKKLCDEQTQPQSFLGSMSSGDVLTLSGREGDNLLPFSTP